jgi:hypothetical protein
MTQGLRLKLCGPLRGSRHVLGFGLPGDAFNPTAEGSVDLVHERSLVALVAKDTTDSSTQAARA